MPDSYKYSTKKEDRNYLEYGQERGCWGRLKKLRKKQE